MNSPAAERAAFDIPAGADEDGVEAAGDDERADREGERADRDGECADGDSERAVRFSVNG